MTNLPAPPQENSEQHVSVAVIGGGPAGSAAAMVLARAAVPVIIIEGSDKSDWVIGEGLPPLARPLLHQLGIWERFIDDGHVPSFGNSSAWGSETLIDQSFIFDPNGNGWHLDRHRFDDMLMKEAIKVGAVREFQTKVTSCKINQRGHWELKLVSQQGLQSQIIAKFVIDATGRQSWFARRQRAGRINYDRLVGLVTLLVPKCNQTDENSLTVVEAVREGWWYSALIPDGKLVVAYMSDGDLASTKTARRADGWRALLKQTHHTRDRVEAHGYEILAGPRMVCANSSHLTRMTGESWLAVGDAASAFDPLSSQGILAALETAISAAEAIQSRLQGRTRGFMSYANSLNDKFLEYLSRRDFYYAQEQRWPESLFWQRRSAVAEKGQRWAVGHELGIHALSTAETRITGSRSRRIYPSVLA
jgi:flavin-dependent dehydrogenase